MLLITFHDACLPQLLCSLEVNSSSSRVLQRRKRLLYFTPDRRLTFPPGAVLALTPTFQFPFWRNIPVGYGTGVTISVPFKRELKGRPFKI
jgi:hypothetical protein